MVEAEGGGRRTRLPGTPVIRWPSFHMILRIGHPSSTPPPHLAAEGRKKMQSALTVMKKNRLRVIRMNDASSSSSIVSTYVHLFCLRLSSGCTPSSPLSPRSRNDLSIAFEEWGFEEAKSIDRWAIVIASLSYFSTNPDYDEEEG